jgi:hypothetical protein
MTRKRQEAPATRARHSTGRYRAPRLRITPAGLLGAIAAVTIGTLGATAAAAGSYAYLSATTTVGAASTVVAGTSSLKIQLGAGTPATSVTLPATVWNQMLPGDVVGQSITVVNDGDTSLAVTSRISATSAFEIRVVLGACPAGVIGGGSLTTTAVALTTLTAGSTATVCVQSRLPVTAANGVQGTTPAMNVILDGTELPG